LLQRRHHNSEGKSHARKSLTFQSSPETALSRPILPPSPNILSPLILCSSSSISRGRVGRFLVSRGMLRYGLRPRINGGKGREDRVERVDRDQAQGKREGLYAGRWVSGRNGGDPSYRYRKYFCRVKGENVGCAEGSRMEEHRFIPSYISRVFSFASRGTLRRNGWSSLHRPRSLESRSGAVDNACILPCPLVATTQQRCYRVISLADLYTERRKRPTIIGRAFFAENVSRLRASMRQC